jgi:GAF domain-containing protein
MYGAIENAVDFLIYRRKHEAENYLKRLAHTLLRAEREETIDRAVVDDPYERLGLAMAALLRADGDRYSIVSAQGWNGAAPSFEREHDVVRFLETERRCLELRDLRERVRMEFAEPGVMPAIAVPIFEGDDLRGFALYGLHGDGTKLDPDERDVLESLCQTAAQAYVQIENLRMRQLLRLPEVRL